MRNYHRRTVLGSIAAGAVFGLGATPATAAEPAAAATFEDQTRGRGRNGARVRVAEATLDDGGFVVIHNDLLLDVDPNDSNAENFRRVVNSVAGVSEFLPPGTRTSDSDRSVSRTTVIGTATGR